MKDFFKLVYSEFKHVVILFQPCKKLEKKHRNQNGVDVVRQDAVLSVAKKMTLYGF